MDSKGEIYLACEQDPGWVQDKLSEYEWSMASAMSQERSGDEGV